MHDIFSEKIFKITRPNFYDAKNFRTEEDKPYSSYEYGNIQTHGHTKLTVLAKSAEFGKGYLNIFFFFYKRQFGDCLRKNYNNNSSIIAKIHEKIKVTIKLPSAFFRGHFKIHAHLI